MKVQLLMRKKSWIVNVENKQPTGLDGRRFPIEITAMQCMGQQTVHEAVTHLSEKGSLQGFRRNSKFIEAVFTPVIPVDDDGNVDNMAYLRKMTTHELYRLAIARFESVTRSTLLSELQIELEEKTSVEELAEFVAGLTDRMA